MVAADPAVLNELGVTLEELTKVRHRLWPFLRERTREAFVQHLVWIPRYRQVNSDVAGTAYQARWLEEIAKLGGWQQLDVYRELVIRYSLVREFGVQELRAP